MNIQRGQQCYHQLIDAWNNRDASTFANLFSSDSVCIGFDGSEMFGKEEILKTLSVIFKDHPTAKYVTIIREVKNLSDELVMIRAHVGMVPRDKNIVDASKNAIQIMVARMQQDSGQIILFQNTPAQYHGRPQMQESLTIELQKKVDESLR